MKIFKAKPNKQLIQATSIIYQKHSAIWFGGGEGGAEKSNNHTNPLK